MAKQTGHGTLKGKLGNLVYYNYRGKPVVRTDGSKEKKYYKTAKSFARSRENCDEFGRAHSIKSRIRHGVGALLMFVKDGYMNNRLAMTLLELEKMDEKSKRGKRTVTAKNLEKLKGFEFNREALMRNLVHFEYEATIEKETGTMSVIVKPFVPKDTITAPEAATHFKLVAGGICIDLNGKKEEKSFKESNLWKVDEEDVIGVELIISLPMKVEGPMMLFFGIQFYDDYCGLPSTKSYVKKNGLKLVEVRG
jgi:hypothetical protein